MDFDLEYIYEKYVESSDGSSNKEEYFDETVMMQAVLEDAEHVEELLGNVVMQKSSYDHAKSI